jgi:hypothetical protein
MIQFKWKECYGCSSPTRCEAEKTCYIIAPRAAEAGEDKELAAGVLRLTGTIRYLVGIAERGEGRSIRHDETVESFVLHYVQRLEQGRPAIIEGAPDMELKKLIENAPVGDFGNELRAAPSLSREEATSLEQIDAMIAAWFEEANKPGATFVSRMEAALRAKVREASKSRP